MRKKNREVPKEEIAQIIDQCTVCRVAFADENIPYIVPMNFGYTLQQDGLTLYFHCANEGKKLDILAKNNNVCFEMDCSHELITGDTACDYTFAFESVIGNGTIECINTRDEKIEGLNILMRKYSDAPTFQYNENHVNAVTILKLTVTEYAGKRLEKRS